MFAGFFYGCLVCGWNGFCGLVLHLIWHADGTDPPRRNAGGGGFLF
ncbi:hypothetical protein [Flavobacterium sp.]|jgi:hypothetical protein